MIPVYDKNGKVFAEIDPSIKGTLDCATVTYAGRIFTFQGGAKIQDFKFVERPSRKLQKSEIKG